MSKGKILTNYDYVDVNAESFLLDFFDKPQSQKEAEISDILNDSPNKEVKYHLSPIRQFILDWYPFEKDSTVLEIGAGCGAITGVLCKKAGKVIANELTQQRSDVIRKRYSDLKNLTVMTCNMNDIKLDHKVDYVTVIGVLEYAGRYFNREGDGFIDPYINFLKKIQDYLKPGGKVMIAIENKLGLKYLAGGREDHYGNMFSSVENYPYYTGISTFSKKELKRLIKAAGYSESKFYYPYPDYKLPKAIFSEEGLKSDLNLSASSYLKVSHFPHPGLPMFNEVVLGKTLTKENILSKFSNSFLVEVTL